MNKLRSLTQINKLLGPWQVVRFLTNRLRGHRSIDVRLPSSKSPIRIRFNNSDLVLLLGVFLHGDCHVSLSPHPACILDLGANTGLTARAWSQQFPDAKIIAVEPDEDTHALCRTNTAAQPHTTCLKRIVSASSGFGMLVDPSAISMARQFIESTEATANSIPMSTIDELLNEYTSKGPILVKMDIEGAERSIFEQAGPWLGRVHGVIVEPHGVGTDELIRSVLGSRGFSVHQVGEKILGLRNPWR